MIETAVAGVLFDLDGTLLDHETAAAEALLAWVAGYGVTDIDAELLVARWFELDELHFPVWRRGEISFTEQRRRRTRDFLPSVGVEVRDEELEEHFGRYLKHYESGWQAFDDAATALRKVAAAGLKVGILTNGEFAQQTQKLAAIGLTDLAGPVFASSTTGRGKPSPEFYLEACEALGLQPEHVVVVGDNYELDVVGARAAGLQAIHLDRRGNHPEPDPGES